MNEKIKEGYHCVVEDAPADGRSYSAFIRRIPNPASYFKNDGERESMFAAADHSSEISASQIASRGMAPQ